MVRPKEPDTGKALPPIAYEPKGRRDPFTPIFLGKDNAALSVSAVKLTGVVGGRGGLLALVEAPDGVLQHIVADQRVAQNNFEIATDFCKCAGVSRIVAGADL